jgi:hypothetical protein
VGLSDTSSSLRRPLVLPESTRIAMFLEELKERESPNVESRDEHTQGSHASRQLMHVMEALGWFHFGDS